MSKKIRRIALDEEPSGPTPCPKCGTSDCISDEEYKTHITITGAGVIGVPSSAVLRSCSTRQTIKYLGDNIKKFIR